MGTWFRTFSAIISRLLFFVHSAWSLRSTIYRRHVDYPEETSNDECWILTLILGLLVLEGIYTLFIKKGNEYKYFWPSGFFYLGIMIPITFLLELYLLEEELTCAATKEESMKRGNITYSKDALKSYCQIRTVSNREDQKLRSAIEIGMLGVLVMGRWLLPRGELTRDQLSALLLSFISNGADVVEFLNTWNDFPILRTRAVVYSVLVIYSWSLLQFTVVTTKTTDEYVEDEARCDIRDLELSFAVVSAFAEELVVVPGDTIQKPRGRIESSNNDVPRYLRKLARRKTALDLNHCSPARQRALTLPVMSNGRDHLRIRAGKLSKRLASVEAFRKPRSQTTVSGLFYLADKHSKLRRAETFDWSSRAPLTPIGAQAPKVESQKFHAEHDKSIDIPSRRRAVTILAPAPTYLRELVKNEQREDFCETPSEAKKTRSTSLLQNKMAKSDSQSNLSVDKFDTDLQKRAWSLRFDQDVFQLLVALFSLELPYLASRMFFSIIYKVSSITMLFYTAKNVVMITFLGYRMWVIFRGFSDDEELIEKDTNKKTSNSNSIK